MEKFISADSHVVEPRNLFVERMDRRFGIGRRGSKPAPTLTT